MIRINLNDLAKRISQREGKKKSLSIAQIKEVISLTLDELSKSPLKAIIEILKPRKK